MVNSNEYGGRSRKAFFSKTLASSGLATGDTIALCRIPKGARIMGGSFCWDTAQGGTATLAIGITGTTGKYLVAAVTNATTNVAFANSIATNLGAVTTAEEAILATNAAAAWTASSILRGWIEYVVD
jgi:hypothetical protein